MLIWMLGFSLSVVINVLLMVQLARQGNMLMCAVVAIMLGWLSTVFFDQVKAWRKAK